MPWRETQLTVDRLGSANMLEYSPLRRCGKSYTFRDDFLGVLRMPWLRTPTNLERRPLAAWTRCSIATIRRKALGSEPDCRSSYS